MSKQTKNTTSYFHSCIFIFCLSCILFCGLTLGATEISTNDSPEISSADYSNPLDTGIECLAAADCTKQCHDCLFSCPSRNPNSCYAGCYDTNSKCCAKNGKKSSKNLCGCN